MPYWLDGNNLIGQSAAAAKKDPRIRRTFLSTLSSYHRARGGKFLVYFDGDDPDRSAPPPGVRIRYSAPLSTDEAIVCRLKEIQRPSEVIVVTNDRELMSRCRAAGAKTIGWNAFHSKMQAGPGRHNRKEDRDDPVDVEDWFRYFGLNKTDH